MSPRYQNTQEDSLLAYERRVSGKIPFGPCNEISIFKCKERSSDITCYVVFNNDAMGYSDKFPHVLGCFDTLSLAILAIPVAWVECPGTVRYK